MNEILNAGPITKVTVSYKLEREDGTSFDVAFEVEPESFENSQSRAVTPLFDATEKAVDLDKGPLQFSLAGTCKRFLCDTVTLPDGRVFGQKA